MDIQARADHLARMMGDRLDIRGQGLEAKLARAGKRLPRHIRDEAGLVVDALTYREHPKLARQVDEARLRRAVKTIERYLKNVDPWARRRGIFLDWLAGNAFGVLVMIGLVVALVVLRG